MIPELADVQHRDPLCLIDYGFATKRVQSCARFLDAMHRPEVDPRQLLASEVVSESLHLHPDEWMRWYSDGNGPEKEIGKAIAALVNRVSGIFDDLPERLWKALLTELGNSRTVRASAIVAAHHQACKTIIAEPIETTALASTAAD